MTPSSNQKRGDRRARQNKRSGGTSLTRQVSTVKTQLVGRQQIATVFTNSSGNIVLVSKNLDPVSIGDRAAVLAGAFERYRILSVNVFFRTTVPSTVCGTFAMGIHDDAGTGVVPSSPDQIMNYRSSRLNPVWKDGTISYVPIDKMRWYYTNSDSVGDPRFVTQAVFYLMSDASDPINLPANIAGTLMIANYASQQVGVLVAEYHYVFDGPTRIAD